MSTMKPVLLRRKRVNRSCISATPARKRCHVGEDGLNRDNHIRKNNSKISRQEGGQRSKSGIERVNQLGFSKRVNGCV